MSATYRLMSVFTGDPTDRSSCSVFILYRWFVIHVKGVNKNPPTIPGKSVLHVVRVQRRQQYSTTLTRSPTVQLRAKYTVKGYIRRIVVRE